MSRESGSAALRDLREPIVRENDPEKLRERTLNINVLLNMIEDPVAHLECRFHEATEPLISPLSPP
jgi:hypothetical protein